MPRGKNCSIQWQLVTPQDDPPVQVLVAAESGSVPWSFSADGTPDVLALSAVA